MKKPKLTQCCISMPQGPIFTSVLYASWHLEIRVWGKGHKPRPSPAAHSGRTHTAPTLPASEAPSQVTSQCTAHKWTWIAPILSYHLGEKRMADMEWPTSNLYHGSFHHNLDVKLVLEHRLLLLTECQKIYFSGSMNSTLLFMPWKPWSKPSNEGR